MATESWEIDIYGNVVYYSYDPSGRLYKGEKTVCYSDSECYGERFHLGFTNAYVENIVGAHNMLYELNLFGSNDFSELPLMSLSTETIGGSTWELSLNRNIYYSNYVASSVIETELNKEVIYVNNRTIYLEELQTVSVFSVTGGVVFSGTASSIEIAQPGVYVVRTARGVHKLVIS